MSLNSEVLGGSFSLKPPSVNMSNHAQQVTCLLLLIVKFATIVQH